MQPADCAGLIDDARALFVRFLAGFDENNRTAQAPGLPNHVVWTLGHCAMYAHRAAEKVRGDQAGPLPAAHWVVGDGRAGGGAQFDTESVCFGSKPTDEPEIYPSLKGAVAAFNQAHDDLRAAVLASVKLERSVDWGSAVLTADRLVVRMAFHLGTHAGQLVDLRRALGLGSIF